MQRDWNNEGVDPDDLPMVVGIRTVLRNGRIVVVDVDAAGGCRECYSCPPDSPALASVRTLALARGIAYLGDVTPPQDDEDDCLFSYEPGC